MKPNFLLIFLFLSCFLALPMAAQDLNIVFVGNSITQGVLLEDPATQAPPARTAAWLEDQMNVNVAWRNCGVAGTTTVDYLPINEKHFNRVVKAADELIAANPNRKLVFPIMLGTNDSAVKGPFGSPVPAVSYYTNMMVLIDALLEKYPKSLIVIHYPTWYSPNTYNGAIYLLEGLNRLQSYIPMIDRLVTHFATTAPGQVYLGDTAAFDFFKNNFSRYLAPEEGNAGTFYLHPNREGAQKLAEYWGSAISKLFKQ